MADDAKAARRAHEPAPSDVARRFWSRVSKTDGCWLWLGRHNRTQDAGGGYGRISVQGKQAMAHRVAWELLVGPIPVEMTLDHLCLNKLCVNPAHLEVVSRGENARRYMSSLTHCKNGHEFTPDNTRPQTTGSGARRHCRACHREWDRQRRARRKEQPK
jgi:hypothetical protein